ncbi:MAG: capsular biosynthesis protein [Vicinamibacterales bacterium]
MSARQSQAMSKSAGSNVNEAFRSLRSTVKFASSEQPIRSVLVVDIDRDTRSSVAEQLATAFAESGDRCLLIDTDARAATDQSAGFFDLLTNDAAVDAVASQSGADKLIRIGPGRAGSPDALASDAFDATLKRLIDSHGVAIMSSAPLPRYADALAIAPRVDAVMLVVTSGGTRRQRAIDASDALDRVGARILGVVMVEPKSRRFW